MKQKDDFLKKVVIALGIFLLIFTIAVFVVFVVTGGSEPAVLITCVFAACLGEGSICGLLKLRKNKDTEEINYKTYQPAENNEEDIDVAG